MPATAALSMRSLVRTLVQSELGDRLDGDDAFDEQLFQKTFQNLSLTPRSRRGPSEEAAVDDLISRHLLESRRKDSRGLDRHLRFQGLRNRMQGQPVLHDSSSRSAVLTLLFHLRGSTDAASSEPGRNSDAVINSQASRAFSEARFDLGRGPSEPFFNSFGAGGSGAAERSPEVHVGWQIGGGAGTPSKLAEAKLARDLLFALQGVESECFKFSGADGSSGSFQVDPAVVLSRPAWILSQRVLELASLHLQLNAAGKALEEEQQSNSLLYQAFCEALRGQLQDYYKVLALLMSRSSSLSLRGLWTWLQKPLERLRLLGSLVQACTNLFGGALASAVYGFVHGSGDLLAQEACVEVLRCVVGPLLAMIRAWMTEGELQDPFGEFFVCADASVPLEELWTRMYSLEIEMVPSFLTLDLARKILLTGKSVNFIRLSCPGQSIDRAAFGEAGFLEGGSARDGLGAGAILALPTDPHDQEDIRGSSSDETSLRSLLANLTTRVERAALQTNTQLVRLMMDHYALVEHSFALRRFLLLGQGDFVESLMDGAQEDLNRDASKIHRHQLMGVLDMALRQSNAQFCPPDVLARLGVKLMGASSGERGWDIFLLDYSIDSPLHVVFTPAAMQQYDRAFAFLWKLRRVSHALASCWSQHMTLQRHLVSCSRQWGDRAPELRLETRQTLHRCTCLRNELHHFVQNVQSYVMCEVLETSWAKLQDGWQACTDLDQVILEHQRYLAGLEEGAFLAKGSETVLAGLTNLLTLALDFCSLQEQACASAFEAAEALSEAPDETDFSSRLRSGNAQLPFARSLAECRAQLDQLGATFLVKLQALLRALEDQPAMRHLSSDLSFLLCRLDFNAYYELKRKGPLDER